eukprot:6458295-Amphidinium_carterae.1
MEHSVASLVAGTPGQAGAAMSVWVQLPSLVEELHKGDAPRKQKQLLHTPACSRKLLFLEHLQQSTNACNERRCALSAVNCQAGHTKSAHF